MIEKLDNNEQILLMYLADELDAQARLEVEQLLAVDANLRGELQELEECQRILAEGMARLDEAESLGSTESAAVRRASREIRRRLARPEVVAEAAPAFEPHRRPLWWAYPAGAAAIVVLAAAIWMPSHHQRMSRQIVHNFEPVPGRLEPYYYGHGYGALTRLFTDSWDQPGDFDDLDMPADDAPAASRAIQVSDAHDVRKDGGVPVDQLNQLLLSADASD